MNDLLVELRGERLTLDSFYEDYRNRILTIGGPGFWKFERQQDFQEHENSSWDAFVRGDWDEVVRLVNKRADGLREHYQRLAAHGVTANRVRVVAEPISRYLQWELHSLRQRAECGERISVIGPEHIAQYEQYGELPEIIVLGNDAVYRVLYTDDGFAEGAIRSVYRDAVAQWQGFIESLHSRGESIGRFFDRKV
ncbi:MAG: DUF6879 family protein, partial [Sciscionella sp.]